MAWVKIKKKIVEWEWYQNPKMLLIFINLIIHAVIEDKRLNGIPLKRGQVLTSRYRLKEQTGLSEQNIRTCLKRLEKSGEIILKTTNRYTVVTICNYNLYQGNTAYHHTELTSRSPANVQQLTTYKKEKNLKNKEKGWNEWESQV